MKFRYALIFSDWRGMSFNIIINHVLYNSFTRMAKLAELRAATLWSWILVAYWPKGLQRKYSQFDECNILQLDNSLQDDLSRSGAACLGSDGVSRSQLSARGHREAQPRLNRGKLEGLHNIIFGVQTSTHIAASSNKLLLNWFILTILMILYISSDCRFAGPWHLFGLLAD